MGKPRKRSEDELRAEARARVEDLPAETAAGRLEPGETAGGESRPPGRGQQSGGQQSGGQMKAGQTTRPKTQPER